MESTSAGHNLARIYRNTPTNLFHTVLSKGKIEAISKPQSQISEPHDTTIKTVGVSSTTRAIVPDTDEFSIEELCIKRLKALSVGNAYAADFHRLAELILRRVFQNSLRNFTIEKEINEGTKRVDIVARNFADKGFVRRLDSHYHIPSANIFIECKNYRDDPSNPETDQIANRLFKGTGMFGFLIYRACDNRALLRKRLKQFVREEKYVMDLNQEDLITLLKLRKQGERSKVDDLLEEKLDLLTLQVEGAP